MKIATRWIWGTAVVSLAVLLGMTVGLPVVQGQAAHVRWDIISATASGQEPGGVAAALANDGSKIVLTGSGTFVAPPGGDGTSSATTGGGTWHTFNASDVSTGSGKYEVTGLVRWEQAPGTLPASVVPDLIGNAAERRAGLAVLRVEYSDGKHGILVVSCNLAGTPGLFEGITASKGFVDYFNRVAPVRGVNANRTIFHVM